MPPTTDRHKTPTITFRPPADLRSWLTDLARITGRPVGSIVVSALREYKERTEPEPDQAPAE
jgi:hypothetical protein